MKPEDLKKTLAIGAVEECDAEGLLVPPPDREAASRAAGAPLPLRPSAAVEDRFLAARAAALLDRLRPRFPESGRWLDGSDASSFSRHPLLAILILAAAAILGYLGNELGPEKRINILSLHLLAILGWSLLIYLNEIRVLFGKRPPALLSSVLAAVHRPRTAPTPGSDPAYAVLARARGLFESRWSRLLAPVEVARVKALLHLAAFVLAAAAIAGMYVRGLASEYRAIWESTFLVESEQLLALLKMVLGPAVAISGEALPSAAELDLLRGAAAEGENAARWIHWYATTVALFVLLPRGVLALVWRIRAGRLARSLPYRGTAPDYFARLLASSSGPGRAVAVVPYNFDPDEATKAALALRLVDALGAAVEATWLSPVNFGEEEAPDLDPAAEASEFVPLFSLAATPERETHLQFFRSLAVRSPRPLRLVLLDAASFDRKARDLGDAEQRRRDRAAAWAELFADESVALILHPESLHPVPPS